MGIHCGCGNEIVAKNPTFQRLLDTGRVTQCDSCTRPFGKWSRDQYEDYLKTEWWAIRRQRALILAGHKCQVCGCRNRLEVHHNDYSRLGGELDSDLFVMCHEHHKLLHAEVGMVY